LDAEDYNKKGDIFFDNENLLEALPCFEKATELDPDNAQYWQNRGRVNQKLKRSDDALSCFEKATELDPDNGERWVYLADELAVQRNFEKSLSCIDKSLKLDPKNDDWKNFKNHVTLGAIVTNFNRVNFDDLQSETPDGLDLLADSFTQLIKLMQDTDEYTLKHIERIFEPLKNPGDSDFKDTVIRHAEAVSQAITISLNSKKRQEPFSSRITSLMKQQNVNHYDIMGLHKYASHIEIQKRFRELSLKFHPDKEPSALSQQVMKQIIEAYKILKDPVKRKEYDNTIIDT
tara:strand:- start:380 stop:1246 length:867 start_codon:yes stop_codon:yes gene_type:complete